MGKYPAAIDGKSQNFYGFKTDINRMQPRGRKLLALNGPLDALDQGGQQPDGLKPKCQPDNTERHERFVSIYAR